MSALAVAVDNAETSTPFMVSHRLECDEFKDFVASLKRGLPWVVERHEGDKVILTVGKQVVLCTYNGTTVYLLNRPSGSARQEHLSVAHATMQQILDRR